MYDLAPSILPPDNRFRDSWCGTVLADRVDNDLRVAGWVHRRRDHGGLIFIDLRDRTGLLQLVFDPEHDAEAHGLAGELRSEDVITAAGTVVRREPDTVNEAIPTGEVEVRVVSLERLSDADTPPFPVEGYAGQAGEELRLRHRTIDLRRPSMQRALTVRHRVTSAVRTFLDAAAFVDVETPILTRSTPEGARDFLVPASSAPGSFYALPQSPQLFKQLLMCAGFERYYQIARCFRDEATRADRQPDFTQIDLEMSFVTADDVMELNERLVAHALAAADIGIHTPIARITYDDAMDRYGTDRPDTRFGMEICDLTEALTETEFKVFRSVATGGGTIRGINAGRREMSRAELDGLIGFAQEWGAKGLVWAFREGDGWRSPTAKFLSADELAELNGRLDAEEGDLLLIVADEPAVAARVLGALRLHLADRFELLDADHHELVWVTDWPLFARDADEERWDALHHPFTAPDGPLDPDDPGSARALAYDLVWNGTEIGGGSIRIHDPELQQRVFTVLGIDAEEANERFGFLLDALRYGAPPHGGIAFGLDRIVAIALGTESIRDVIAFPKTASGADPLTGAPAPVDQVQLRDLGLRIAPGGPTRPGATGSVSQAGGEQPTAPPA
ncbi:MAG: aspartate--tRNA ligase [Solirubrobacterales bacterium]